jgi:predicted nucleotidyltransferase/DNA-binding XRE family transcriptional regulator
MEAGALIRAARTRARLSQTDLARRVGVTQPVISAYELGRREPGVVTLSRLIAATGHELVVEARPTPGMRPGLPDSRLGRCLRRNRRAIVETAARRGARHVRVFGSAARGDDDAASDVDLLVDLDPGVSLVGIAGLTRELSELLKVRVDVVPAADLKGSIRESVVTNAIPL